MKIFISLAVIFSLLTIGGCGMDKNPDQKTVQGETDPEKSPAPPAIADDFTRDYLTSSKEAEKGYYTFESKTKGYTMLFPKDAVISKDFGNERNGNSSEAVMFSGSMEKAKVNTQVIYENLPITKDIAANLDLLSTSVSYDGKYEEMKNENATIFYGEKTSDIDDAISYNFFSFIKTEESNQGIRFMYSASCKKDDKDCTSNEEKHKQIAKKIMDSVKFKQVQTDEIK
ncbi:hypothetical protein CEF21_05820 [Bacillus sp. FJAT-42376]|uniref:hypothetical protein n=1 Tax=Bacillus sp. FJAT-42376 TaxID=2014076 RepID=UPI000F4F31F5|nr:hypothetical protein [Bacillus sp. FJAT-42376]AZB41859.1 hypothetical protein CEF21_05820 [Bacillus sp. FJAT-42376]